MPRQALSVTLTQLIGIGEQEILPDARRRSNTLTFTIVGTVTLAAFAIYNLRQPGDPRLYSLGVVQLLEVLALLLPAIVLTMRAAPPWASEGLLVAGGFVIFASNVLFGGQVGDSPYWTFVFPYLVFFLRGQRIGWAVGIAYSVGVPALMLFSSHRWTYWVYQDDQCFYYGIAFFFNVVTAACFNMQRSRFQAYLWEQVEFHTAEVRRYWAALQHNALHDQPSGLLNRQGIVDRLRTCLQKPDDAENYLLVVQIRFFRIAELSSIVGGAKLDQSVVQLAQLMRDELPDLQVLGRVSQDTLGLVMRSVYADARAVGSLLAIPQLRDSAELGGFAVHVEMAFGVAVQRPGAETSADELMRNAEQALLYAVTHRLEYQFFDANLREQFVSRNRYYEMLREAVMHRQLMLYYQPQIELRSGKVVGAEALTRWQVVHEGMIAPDIFIPIIESTGLLRHFSVWTVERALCDCAAWQQNLPGVGVSVNLSADALREPMVLRAVEDVLASTGLNPALVIIELTESVLLKSPREALACMESFRAMGVQLSIDDYGAGFSSLTYLKQLPAREMKIDKSFVGNVLGASKDRAIVWSSIELGHDLGLKVLAEGIEDEDTAVWLREAGCDLGQGWQYAKALPLPAFLSWADSRNMAVIT